MAEVWTLAEFRRNVSAQRTGIHPEHWPDGVEIISMQGISLLGLDTEGNLYLDGRRLYTAKRFDWYERTLALAAVIFTGIGSLATAWQAWGQILS